MKSNKRLIFLICRTMYLTMFVFAIFNHDVLLAEANQKFSKKMNSQNSFDRNDSFG